MEKYGFVYLWYDRKHKRFYLGCHWGFEEDGYICSSRWMRKAYKRRPEDFKRRIVSRVYTNRADLYETEYHWLSMIKDEELHNRYYNLQKKKHNHWSTDTQKYSNTIKKLSSPSPDTKRKRSESSKKMWQSEEYRAKLLPIIKNTWRAFHNSEQGQQHKLYLHSEECKEKQRMAMQSDEVRKKIGELSRGRKASPEKIEKNTKFMRQYRYNEMYEAIKNIPNPSKLYEKLRYSIPKLMEALNLSRNQTHMLLNHYGITKKKYQKLKNIGTTGYTWWNNGEQNKFCLVSPGEEWVAGRFLYK